MRKNNRPQKNIFYFFYFTQNLKIKELAKKFGVSQKTIHVWRKEFSIPKKSHRNVAHPRFNPPKEEIEQLYSELRSSVKVGKHYGKDATTVLSCLRRYDIPIQQQITTTGTSWNKGLTKETNEKVRLMSEQGAKSRKGLLAGDKNPAKRPEVRDKIGNALQKRWDDPEEREKIMDSFKKRPDVWNKGKTGVYSEKQLKAISERQIGRNYEQRYGKDKAKEIRKKLSEVNKGDKNPMWNNPVLERVTYRDTPIELALREELKSRGISNFESNKFMLGYVPDIIFKEEKIIIEADGCYWHGCKQCKPWKGKEIDDKRILNNIRRGQRKNKRFRDNDYLVLRFWEHEIKQDVKTCVDKIELCLLRQRVKMEVKK